MEEKKLAAFNISMDFAIKSITWCKCDGMSLPTSKCEWFRLITPQEQSFFPIACKLHDCVGSFSLFQSLYKKMTLVYQIKEKKLKKLPKNSAQSLSNYSGGAEWVFIA